MMAFIGVLGTLVVLLAFWAWRRSYERARDARLDAEVTRLRSVEQSTIASIDSRTAADALRAPVDVAEDLIAAARRREGK